MQQPRVCPLQDFLSDPLAPAHGVQDQKSWEGWGQRKCRGDLSTVWRKEERDIPEAQERNGPRNKVQSAGKAGRGEPQRSRPRPWDQVKGPHSALQAMVCALASCPRGLSQGHEAAGATRLRGSGHRSWPTPAHTRVGQMAHACPHKGKVSSHCMSTRCFRRQLSPGVLTGTQQTAVILTSQPRGHSRAATCLPDGEADAREVWWPRGPTTVSLCFRSDSTVRGAAGEGTIFSILNKHRENI